MRWLTYRRAQGREWGGGRAQCVCRKERRPDFIPQRSCYQVGGDGRRCAVIRRHGREPDRLSGPTPTWSVQETSAGTPPVRCRIHAGPRRSSESAARALWAARRLQLANRLPHLQPRRPRRLSVPRRLHRSTQNRRLQPDSAAAVRADGPAHCQSRASFRTFLATAERKGRP